MWLMNAVKLMWRKNVGCLMRMNYIQLIDVIQQMQPRLIFFPYLFNVSYLFSWNTFKAKKRKHVADDGSETDVA